MSAAPEFQSDEVVVLMRGADSASWVRVPMTAKYATTCGVCSSRIQPGEEIARSGENWAHAACAADSPTQPAASPAAKKAPAKAARPRRADMPSAEGALEV